MVGPSRIGAAGFEPVTSRVSSHGHATPRRRGECRVLRWRSRTLELQKWSAVSGRFLGGGAGRCLVEAPVLAREGDAPLPGSRPLGPQTAGSTAIPPAG